MDDAAAPAVPLLARQAEGVERDGRDVARVIIIGAARRVREGPILELFCTHGRPFDKSSTCLFILNIFVRYLWRLF